MTSVDVERADACWTSLAEAGRLSGHVVCRCPACGERALIAYRPPSQPWPECRACRYSDARMNGAQAPRVAPLEDVTAWAGSKRPGEPRSRRELARAGYRRRGNRAPNRQGVDTSAACDPGGVHERSRESAAADHDDKLDDDKPP
jgi:hypothetical protein